MRKQRWKMPAICWTKRETYPSPDRQSISKASATTTADGYTDGPLSLATLCFISSKQAHRSWNHHGKAHISSTKQSQEGHIDYATPKQGWTSRTHGTPCSCADSILRADRFFPFPSLSVTKRWQQTTLNHRTFGAKQ
jgi:hypothetical protein